MDDLKVFLLSEATKTMGRSNMPNKNKRMMPRVLSRQPSAAGNLRTKLAGHGKIMAHGEFCNCLVCRIGLQYVERLKWLPSDDFF